MGQIISSIDNIYETCQMLTKMQSSKGRANTLADDRDDPHEKVKNLQEKLDQAVTKISELTDVLKHLDKDYTVEKYYEDLALQKSAAENKGRPLGAAAAASQSYGVGGASSNPGARKQNALNESTARK